MVHVLRVFGPEPDNVAHVQWVGAQYIVHLQENRAIQNFRDRERELEIERECRIYTHIPVKWQNL